jgi:hypothetical protein
MKDRKIRKEGKFIGANNKISYDSKSGDFIVFEFHRLYIQAFVAAVTNKLRSWVSNLLVTKPTRAKLKTVQVVVFLLY